MIDTDFKPYYAAAPGLSADQIRDAMFHTTPALIEYLGGNVILEAFYGWDCGIHAALWHKPMQIGITYLDRFMKDSIRQDIFRPGCSELTIVSPEKMICVYFARDTVATNGEDLILQEKLWLSNPWKGFPMKTVDGKDISEPNLWS